MTEVLPVGTRTRSARLRGPALVGAAAAGAALLLHVRDPHDPGSYGYCPFLLLTGKPCPGCGGLRAINLLTRGDVVAAMSSNLLVVVGVLPVALYWWIRYVVAAVRGVEPPRFVISARTGVLTAIVVTVFWVARLTPWGAWLAP